MWMEWLSNSLLTSLPALNVFDVRDPLQGLVRGHDSRGVLVAPAPAACIRPLCHLLTCLNHSVPLLSSTSSPAVLPGCVCAKADFGNS